MESLIWHTEQRKVSDLIHWDKNPRKITAKQTEDLKKSLEKFNLMSIPVINTDNLLISGHQRMKIMVALGKADDIIDVRVPNRKLTESEIAEANIRENKNVAEWDFDLLAGFDLNMIKDIGFESTELDKIFKPLIVSEDDEVLAQRKTTDIKSGDMFALGEHRLLCGDSTNSDHIIKLLNNKKPVLMVTDPPYGVNYDPTWRDGVDLGVGERSKGKVQNDDVIDWSSVFCLFDVPVIYVWHAGKFTDIVAEGIRKAGYEIINQIIWAKHHFVISRGDYHWQHEPCWYAVKKGNKHNWQGSRDQSTLWQIENNNSFGKKGKKEETVGHGTQKPIECMLRPIINNSQGGDLVCDPFLGSGSTLIACEKSNRVCYGMELDVIYCQVVIDRWEKLTNKKAVKL